MPIKEFESWLSDPIFDTILFTFGMHVTNLGYLEDKVLYITKILDGDTKELDLGLGLDYTVAISDNDNQPLTDLSNLKVKRAKKKQRKLGDVNKRKLL